VSASRSSSSFTSGFVYSKHSSTTMASATTDIKHDQAFSPSKTEDVAEKTSNSSAELEAQYVELDESESARVLRKVDMRLVPMLALLYLVAFIDRSNSKLTIVSNDTQGMLISLKSVTQRLRA
jgi:hypothetical protein